MPGARWLRTGIPWRDLLSRFGSRQTIYDVTDRPAAARTVGGRRSPSKGRRRADIRVRSCPGLFRTGFDAGADQAGRDVRCPGQSGTGIALAPPKACQQAGPTVAA
ncbi:hypothetical protein GCM10010507_09980 [Streptomyces cinnamoneus]|uniref:Uncharacterized protein n=1 Tax=Streptomyces cinnamoneus TaxID=53446 RepID=A0A918TCM6_STRCJ|nr:hypothetical protein GCM10010507_09980 [Streptomyces cinnamoneus]